MKLPKHLKKIFWEIDFDKIDPDKKHEYILQRILDHGDNVATDWMWKSFDVEEIKSCLRKSRALSRKSANFWALILNIQKDQIPCLKRHLSKEPKTLWPY